MSRRAADGASAARLEAVPGGQHGLCPHPDAVHGETPGFGEGESNMQRRGWRLSGQAKVYSSFLQLRLFANTE